MNNRNAKCSCGSEKKFKKCCWNPTKIVPSTAPRLPVASQANADTKDSQPIRRMSPRASMAMIAMCAAAFGSFDDRK